MRINNVHERRLDVEPERIGLFIDSLAGPDDKLWPRDKWMPMVLDQGLKPGSAGGHGPVRYRVREHLPGRRVTFQFDSEGVVSGLDGRHFFEVLERRSGCYLRHTIDADCGPADWIKWIVIVRPLHDALLEDSLDQVERELHPGRAAESSWSIWVRILRKILSRKPG